MAIIHKKNIYPDDPTPSFEDYLLGTNGSPYANKKTQSYTLQAIADLFLLYVQENVNGLVQNNKFRFITGNLFIGGKYADISTNELKEAAILASIDGFLNATNLTVEETELIVFVFNITEYGSFTTHTRKYLFPNMLGKGVYNPMSATFTSENLELIFVDNIFYQTTPEELESNINNVVFDLGDITGQDYLDYINTISNIIFPAGYPLTDNTKIYYFKWVDDEVTYMYYFDEESSANSYGTYGVDGDFTFAPTDLVLFYNSADIPDPLVLHPIAYSGDYNDLENLPDLSTYQLLSEKGAANGYTPLNVSSKVASVYLDIINDLTTGGATSLLSAEQGKLLKIQIDAINTLLTSDNINLDTVQEIVDAIENVQSWISTIIVNDLTTGGTTKALSAQQGVVLKGLVDGKEDSVNKVTTMTGNETSNIVFLTAKAIYDWAVGLFVPQTRTININGVIQDLSTDRTFTVSSGVTLTKKTITSANLTTQDVAGFLTYVNGVTSYAIASNEIVEYLVTDTGQIFKLMVNNRSVGSGQTALTSSDVLEIEFPQETVLQMLGTFVKFNQAASGAYPFVGSGLAAGLIQTYALGNILNQYGNAFVRFIASSGNANSGYRFTDGNTYPTTFFKGVTFFGLFNPIVTTNLSAIIGMPYGSSLTSDTESLIQGAWFNITGNQLQAKCSYASTTSTAPTITITANQWLMCMIEVIDNDAVNKRIRFKVRQSDGTLIYNQDITTNIQPYNVFNNLNSTGCRAVLTSAPGVYTDIFGINAMGFWGQKPNFLRNF